MKKTFYIIPLIVCLFAGLKLSAAMPESLSISGTALAEYGATEEIDMKKLDNQFELYTSLRAGDYSFSDGTTGGTVTEEGIYRLCVNYSNTPATVTSDKIENVYMWAILKNKTLAELEYMGNSVFRAENVTVSPADFEATWVEKRYRIRVKFANGQTDSYGPKDGVNFVLLENFGQWDNPYDLADKYIHNAAPFNLTVNFSVENNYSYTIEDYEKPFPTTLSISGTAMAEYEATEEVEMKKFSDYYELYASLQKGDYSFSDGTTGGSVAEDGTYRISVDYSQKPTSVKIVKIQKVYLWTPETQKSVAELQYAGHSTFKALDIRCKTSTWGEDGKYRIRINFGKGNDVFTETYGPKDGENFALVGNAQWAPSDYNYTPTGYVDNNKSFDAMLNLSASAAYSHSIEDCADPSNAIDETQESGLQIYPTVVADRITINLSGNGFTATVIFVSGQIALQQSTSSETLTLSANELPQGIYIIKINQNGKDISATRIIKL